MEATPTEAPTPEEEPTPEATDAPAEESVNTDGAAAAAAASVSLTLRLPAGLSADGTDVVTQTVNADGAIDPIVIYSEEADTFSAALAEAINKNSSISENSLHIEYNANDDTLTLSGTPSASVELDMEEILIAAMDDMGGYETELVTSIDANSTYSTDITINEGETLVLSAQLTITGNVTITGGGTLKRGSGDGYIVVSAGATLTLDGVTIDGENIQSNHSMFKVESGGNLIIKGNTVIQNCHNGNGEGGAIYNSGTVTLESGSICNNHANSGGGAIKNEGTLTIEGGSINNNESGSGNGGGVCNGYGTINMKGGTISGNTGAALGGGVYNNGTFNMTDGNITGNSANDGGGVYNESVRSFTMSGGKITGNNATVAEDYIEGVTAAGGGVFNLGTFNVSGSPTISGNVVDGTKDADGNLTGGTNSNVYIVNFTYDNEPCNYPVTVTGDLGSSASIYITGTAGQTVVTFADGKSASATGFYCDTELSFEVDTDNDSLKLAEQEQTYEPETYCVCGDKTCEKAESEKDGHEIVTWKPISSLSAITDDGSYYLTRNVTLNATWECNHTVMLSLNGNTITGPSGKDVITVATGGTLIITDCQTSVGSITHAEGATGRGIANYGTLTLWNGSITGNTNSGDKGAGVYNSGTFTMSGTANITNCTAAVDEEYNGGEGGGVYNNLSSTFTMNGGTISGCTAESGGGVYNMNKFTMEGGEITGCIAAYNGGGVYNTDEFTMEGGEITGCIAAYSGGGVYNADEFTMKDGKITGCTTSSSGGGVCSYGTFNMNGGSIAKNSAAGGYSCHGGGVFNAGTFAMSGGSITENTATSATATDNGKGGGVFNNGTFKVSGSPVISGNVKGGTITNGELSGGTANNVFVLTISYSLSGQDTQTTNYPITVESDKPLTSAAEVYITGSEGQQVVTGTDKTTGFYCDNEDYGLVVEGSNLKIAKVHKHKVCCDSECSEHDNKTWQAWNGKAEITYGSNNTAYVYLTGAVTLDTTLTVASGKTLYLCLNGQTLTGASGQNVINVATGASLTITDCGSSGKITHNTGVSGRGISSSGTLNLYGGAISGNTIDWDGAGLNLSSGGTFNMYGGVISENNDIGNGNGGGGVYVGNNTAFNLYGGSITGNSSKNCGGGVFVDKDTSGQTYGTYNMYGGSITGNSASDGGGGVYNGGTFNISGNVTIKDNQKGSADNNVQGTVTVIGDGMTTGASVGVTGTVGSTIVTGSTDKTVFTSDSTDHELVADNGNLKWVEVHKHCVCGKTDCSGDGHNTDTTWTAWTETKSLPNAEGNYYLVNSVTLDETWECQWAVNLCLNGNNITGANGADVIKVASGGNLVITDCAATAGKITHETGAKGHGIYNENGGAVTLWNGSIAGNTTDSNSGGGVCNAYGATFTMYGGSITDNKSTFSDRAVGGGVWTSGSFVVYGGSITGNTKGDGAANNVYLYDTATITVSGNLAEGTRIGLTLTTDNRTAVKGSVDTTVFTSDSTDHELVADGSNLKWVAVHKHCVCGGSLEGHDHDTSTTWTAWTSATSLPTSEGNYYLTQDVELDATWQCGYNVNLCLNGQTITGASGQDVIYLNEGKTLDITDCTTDSTKVGKITHGENATGRGIYNRGTLNFWNGCVTGNRLTGDSDKGAGVCNTMGGNPIFNMYGGSITGNYCKNYGGGVFNDKTWNMSGGEITNNEVNAYGGGVNNTGTFNMTGGSITGNKVTGSAGTYTGGGVYNDGTFNLSGNVTISGNKKESADNNVQGTVTAIGNMGSDAKVGITGGEVKGSTDTTVFTSDNADLELVPVSGGLKLAAFHEHCVCGKSVTCGESHSTDTKWTGIASLSEINESGNYYLTQDVELSTVWIVNADIKLCLNGHSITQKTSGQDVIQVSSTGSLTITDCTTDSTKVGKITGGSRGICNSGKLTLWNGSITGNKNSGVDGGGGGVCNTSFGTFTMHGGSITANVATAGSSGKNAGGGVWNAGTFTMNNGSITGNSAMQGGGVFNIKIEDTDAAAFTMNGGSIANNHASYAGGGVANAGTFDMTGGEITGNTDTNVVGGVLNMGTFKMSGGSITENMSQGKGDNGALSSGGGVVNMGTLNMSGKPVVEDNKTKCEENDEDGTLTDGTVSNVYVYYDSTEKTNYPITVTEELETGASIGITGDLDQTVVTGTTSATGFKCDNTDYELVDNDDSGLKLVAKPVTISGVTLLNETGGEEMTGDTKTKTYDGEAVAYTEGSATGVTGVTLTYTWQKATTTDGTTTYADLTAAPSDAGSYRLHVEAKKNNVTHGTADYDFTISKATPAADDCTVTMRGWTYGETASTPVTTSQYNGNTATVVYTDVSGAVVEQPTNAGTYTATATFPANDNYNAGTATTTFTISQKELTVNVTAANKTYDGTQDATLNTATLNGVEEKDKENVGLDDSGVSAAFENANAGTNKAVKLTGSYTLGGTGKDNYTLKQPTGIKANINQRELTITGATVADKTYNGETDATITAVEFSGLQNSETLTLGEDYTVSNAAFNSADAGDGKTVTFTVTLQNTDKAKNYTLKTAEGTQSATISKATPEARDCTVTMTGWTYGGTANEPQPTSETNPGSESSPITYRYKVKTAEDTEYTETKPTNAGTYTVEATFPANDNYTEATATANFTISPKALTVHVTAANKTYDGTTTATLNTATLNGVVSGDEVTLDDTNVTAAFETKGVGTSKKVILTGSYTLDGADAGNYSLTQPTGLTATISEATLTVKDLAVASKLYDGTNTATISGTPALDGLVTDDDVTLTAGTPTFNSVNVGEGITIRFTDFSISGTDAGNYTLTQPTGIKADITAYTATSEEYSASTSEWTKDDFEVTAAEGWQLSETNTANGEWVESLTRSNETSNGSLTFYVKSVTDGYISTAITKTYRIDKTVPTIIGAENDKTYCAAVTLTITDANLDRVTLNGETVELTADGKLTLDPTAQPATVANVIPLDGATDGEQTVVATDAAGNSTTITLTVNDGHTWGEWTSNGDNTHTRACRFDAEHTETEDCTGGKATCKAKAVCKACGEKCGELDPHNHADLEHVETKDATTTAEGNIEYWHCEDCGKYFKDADATDEITKADTVTAKRKDSAARTGDESNAALWLLLLVGSGAGMATLGKKKKYSK